jgi:hypothetical protein
MKKEAKETLLRDVLRDASDGFRQEVFEASLKELRRRRGNTKTWLRLPLAVAAAFVLTVGLLFFGMANRTPKEQRALLPGGSHTAPASAYAQMEIVTNLRQGMAIVESRQYPSLIVQNSSIRQPVEILGDTELLALFPDKPMGLIADSQGTLQLLFLDSRDGIFRQ